MQRMAGAARRTHLLAAARRRFAEDGYDTTISSIARDAGVSEPLLFKHFASKDELFRAAIVEPLLELLHTHTDAHPHDEPIEDQEHALRSFMRTWAALVREERALALTLLAELNRFPDVAAELAAMVQDHVNAVARQNAATTARPEYRPHDATVATWSGLATATVAGLVADDLDEFVDESLRILLYGLRAS